MTTPQSNANATKRKLTIPVVLALITSLQASLTVAQEAFPITIVSPADNSVVRPGSAVQVVLEVDPAVSRNCVRTAEDEHEQCDSFLGVLGSSVRWKSSNS
jgi:hypothetical protein